eukprot:4042409-Amphidinium_carterae.2
MVLLTEVPDDDLQERSCGSFSQSSRVDRVAASKCDEHANVGCSESLTRQQSLQVQSCFDHLPTHSPADSTPFREQCVYVTLYILDRPAVHPNVTPSH